MVTGLGINKSFWIERSLVEKNVYFIFRRRSKIEIKCEVSLDGMLVLLSSSRLSNLEISEVKKMHKTFYFV